jgi:ABC-2 type transport system permease protein
VAAAAPARFALIWLAVLVYTAAPLALGFLAANIGMGTTGLNAFANTLGLVFAFLGGLFTVGLEMTPAAGAVGQFLPTYWHRQAVERAGMISEASWSGVAPYLGAIGLELLFAAAVAALGLVLGRVRAQRAAVPTGA